MSRAALAAVLGASLIAVIAYGCSKSAVKQEQADDSLGGGGKIAVPGAKGSPEGAIPAGTPATGSRNRLLPEEGKLAIEAPTGVTAGTEAIAKVIVTPGSAFKVNTEFPTKLTLETPDGLTLAKAELKAGGAEKSKGDAARFDDGNLTFEVKMTPAASGSYTVNGVFKFAVCDKAGTTCLAKKEPIAIQVAAN